MVMVVLKVGLKLGFGILVAWDRMGGLVGRAARSVMDGWMEVGDLIR